jgi:hypothetical protein
MTNALEDRIREALAFRAGHTEVSADVSGAPPAAPVRRLGLSARRPRSVRPLALAAAAVVGGGLVGVVLVERGGGDSEPKPTVPADATPVVPVIGDRFGISLDAAPRAAPVATDVTFEVVDAEGMAKAGWSVTDVTAGAVLTYDDGPANGYHYQATVESPDGLRFRLGIERDALMNEPGPADTRVDIDGDPGWIAGEAPLPMVTWSHGERTASLQAQRAVVDERVLVAAAAAIEFAEVDALPAGDVASRGEQLAASDLDDAVLGGTVGGVPWAAEVDPGSLRSIRVATPAGASAMGSDRLSQPTDDPATGVEMSIAGVPGHGAIAYGLAPPAATVVHAVVDGAVVGVLPLHRRPGESFFAVPIPDGLVVSRLDFVDDAGGEVGSRDVPAIPPGLDGNFG